MWGLLTLSFLGQGVPSFSSAACVDAWWAAGWCTVIQSQYMTSNMVLPLTLYPTRMLKSLYWLKIKQCIHYKLLFLLQLSQCRTYVPLWSHLHSTLLKKLVPHLSWPLLNHLHPPPLRLLIALLHIHHLVSRIDSQTHFISSAKSWSPFFTLSSFHTCKFILTTCTIYRSITLSLQAQNLSFPLILSPPLISDFPRTAFTWTLLESVFLLDGLFPLFRFLSLAFWLHAVG